jgi:mannose-1-phosphate guanylyltransferase
MKAAYLWNSGNFTFRGSVLLDEYYRQRRNMVRAPKRFLDQVLGPDFSELDQALQAYLHQVRLRVIRDEVFADASEAQEILEALSPN